jgi:hypothetical protein
MLKIMLKMIVEQPLPTTDVSANSHASDFDQFNPVLVARAELDVRLRLELNNRTSYRTCVSATWALGKPISHFRSSLEPRPASSRSEE